MNQEKFEGGIRVIALVAVIISLTIMSFAFLAVGTDMKAGMDINRTATVRSMNTTPTLSEADAVAATVLAHEIATAVQQTLAAPSVTPGQAPIPTTPTVEQGTAATPK